MKFMKPKQGNFNEKHYLCGPNALDVGETQLA